MNHLTETLARRPVLYVLLASICLAKSSDALSSLDSLNAPAGVSSAFASGYFVGVALMGALSLAAAMGLLLRWHSGRRAV